MATISRKQMEQGVNRIFYVAWACWACLFGLFVIKNIYHGGAEPRGMDAVLVFSIFGFWAPLLVRIAVRWIYRGFQPKT